MTQRVPERLDRLPGENAARCIGDGAGDHDRHEFAGVLEQLIEREQRGLCIERVEDRFDEEQIAARIEQRLRLLVVRVAQFVEGHVARARIVPSGEMLAVFGVGPIAPATKRGLSGVEYLSQASRASFADSMFISAARSSMP